MTAIPTQDTRAGRIAARLTEAFQPIALKVQDDSVKHAGHAGAAPGGETHFTVTVVSERFSGLNRVDRSRIIHSALQTEFATGLHALSLNLSSPNEMPSKKANID